jgi:hypothetical protein
LKCLYITLLAGIPLPFLFRYITSDNKALRHQVREQTDELTSLRT